MKNTSRRFAAFGTPFELVIHGEVTDELVALALPPGTIQAEAEPSLTMTIDTRVGWAFSVEGGPLAEFDGERALCEAVESSLAEHVALTSPEGIFVHAGVVGSPKGAILAAGRSFAGKSSLVSSFLQAGFTYFG